MRQAERNLKSATANYDAELYEEACYEAHQAAEKAMKGLLNLLNRERRGHSISFLALESGLKVPEEVLKCLKYLDKHYIPTRYPDVYDEGAPCDYYTREDADKCLECAKKVMEWVIENAQRIRGSPSSLS